MMPAQALWKPSQGRSTFSGGRKWSSNGTSVLHLQRRRVAEHLGHVAVLLLHLEGESLVGVGARYAAVVRDDARAVLQLLESWRQLLQELLRHVHHDDAGATEIQFQGVRPHERHQIAHLL